MTTPTEQIRAALQKVVDYLPALRDIPPTIAEELSYAFIQSKDALALLDLQPGWQPIETAPKDGTYILANQTGVLEPSMVVVSFDEDWSADGWWMCCDGKNPELPLRGPEPTHWMPLPQPPQEGSHE